MRVARGRFNLLKKSKKLSIVELIEEHYDEPDYLKLSVEELEKLDLIVFMALEPIDLFEAGYVGEELLGVSFCKKETDNLVRTRTTVVRKDKIGQGIGSKINESLEEYVIESGAKKVYCNIYTDNLPSIILKLRRGYLVEGLLKNHDEPGKDEYIMSKFF